MELMNIEDIRKAVNGKIVQGDPSSEIHNISIDSRKLEPGDLFIAIIGERFDGHNFISEAVGKGARALIVDRSIKAYPNIAIIRVKDTTKALQELAHYNRIRYKSLEVIGVTGSVGKTTTKDMIASILQEQYKILKSRGNYNNYYGLPLSLLSLKGNEDLAVVEMAMSNLGEIKLLTEIASPRIGVVTNVGPAHLKNLDNVNNVAKAKQELIEGLPEDGIAILNYDNDFVRGMDEAFTGKRVIYYGLDNDADIFADNINTDEKEKNISFDVNYNGNKISTMINKPGEHNIYNALAAIAVAREYKIDWNIIKDGLKNLNVSSLRLDIKESSGITIINDTYNANPLSMKAGINVLTDLAKDRTIAVLGDMLELGPQEEKAHYKLGKYIARKGINELITVGKLSEIIANGAEDHGLDDSNIYRVSGNDQAVEILQNISGRGDSILIKGSRKMKMERIVDELIS
jgi:UDP-N-acetylmuramoyl-tripeptide--D-alanyl-D-alanine ligase